MGRVSVHLAAHTDDQISDAHTGDASVRIAIRFLLNGNMTLTALLFILLQTAVLLFRFETGYCLHSSSPRCDPLKENRQFNLQC